MPKCAEQGISSVCGISVSVELRKTFLALKGDSGIVAKGATGEYTEIVLIRYGTSPLSWSFLSCEAVFPRHYCGDAIPICRRTALLIRALFDRASWEKTKLTEHRLSLDTEGLFPLGTGFSVSAFLRRCLAITGERRLRSCCE